MREHLYRFTVQSIDAAGAEPTGEPLVFEAGCHDELFSIVARVRGRDDLTPEEATAFAVGLKLFGEVMLRHRAEAPFAQLVPHFGEFMQALKKSLPRD